MKTLAIVLVVVAACSLLSCGTATPTTQTSNITGIRWKLVQLRGQTVNVQPPNGKEPFVLFASDGNRVSGMATCNGFGGTYALEGKSGVKLSQLISTKMACPGMEVERVFMDVLQRITNYQLKKGELWLYEGDTGPLARLIATE